MTLATAHRDVAQQSLTRVLVRAMPELDHSAIGEVSITGITCDSRAVTAGDCFVAAVGTQSDGHDYIPMAISAGACAIGTV